VQFLADVIASTLESLRKKTLKVQQLEEHLKNPALAVRVRRAYIGLENKTLFISRNVIRTRGWPAFGGNSSRRSVRLLPSRGPLLRECDWVSIHLCASFLLCALTCRYMPVPLGFAGPLLLNGVERRIPMATTEGALIASTSRGCAVLTKAGGCRAVCIPLGMSRAPVVTLPTVEESDRSLDSYALLWTVGVGLVQLRAVALRNWLTSPESFAEIAPVFNSASRGGYLRLQSVGHATGMPIPSQLLPAQVKPTMAGCDVHIRFTAFTGDAMGMNMVSLGAHAALEFLATRFPTMTVLRFAAKWAWRFSLADIHAVCVWCGWEEYSMSGNCCTDKKASSVNWVEGRGREVVCEATIPHELLTRSVVHLENSPPFSRLFHPSKSSSCVAQYSSRPRCRPACSP